MSLQRRTFKHIDSIEKFAAYNFIDTPDEKETIVFHNNDNDDSSSEYKVPISNQHKMAVNLLKTLESKWIK